MPVPNNAKVTCLNDLCPVALTSVAMKCFEMLVMAHINTIIPDTLDPHQFAYCPNRSTYVTISIALQTALSHRDKRNVRMLFIDYSSAFNIIVPLKLITKLRILRLYTSLCIWILDFLMGCPLLLKGCLIRPTTIVSSANLIMVLELCAATLSWRYREYRRGLSMHP